MSAPSTFGTFRVLHQIGSGVLGPVFRSYDPQRDRLVAIKAFKLDLVPEAAARFADACRELVAVPPGHAAIVAVVDVGLEGATPYLALEYASGEALDVFLRQSGALSVDRALAMLRPLAQAIDASWEQGVGHGALHPRDVFTTGTAAELRVTGFGIAQALERVGVKPPLRRPYAAPERIGGGEWDQRADVYALAVIAHEMLTGRRPPAAAESEPPLAADGESAPANGESWRAAVAKGMAERREDRFETAVALVEAIADSAGTQPVDGLNAATTNADVVPQAVPKRQARPRRPRPSVIDAPLLPGVDGADDVSALPDEEIAAPEPEAAWAPGPDPEAVTLPEPEPQAEPPQHPTLIDTPPSVTAQELRFSSEDVAPRGDQFEVARSIVDEPASRFPWAATAAVAFAGLVLGTVLGYQIGFGRGREAVIAEVVNNVALQTPAPAGSSATPPANQPAVSEPSAPPAPVPVAVGRLVIQSEPAGALAYVDGRRVGSTPVTVRDVALGGHDVRVTRSGYSPATERVTLSAGATSRTVRLRLRRGGSGGMAPAQAFGSIDVDSRPRGAQVTVDGRRVGQTPMRVPELSPGDHKVLIELTGHRPVSSTVKVVAGEQTRLAVTLEQVGSAQPAGLRERR